MCTLSATFCLFMYTMCQYLRIFCLFLQYSNRALYLVNHGLQTFEGLSVFNLANYVGNWGFEPCTMDTSNLKTRLCSCFSHYGLHVLVAYHRCGGAPAPHGLGPLAPCPAPLGPCPPYALPHWPTAHPSKCWIVCLCMFACLLCITCRH